jgi:hypothetical protein
MAKGMPFTKEKKKKPVGTKVKKGAKKPPFPPFKPGKGTDNYA